MQFKYRARKPGAHTETEQYLRNHVIITVMDWQLIQEVSCLLLDAGCDELQPL